ncbi:hypothetical protein BpHYR1_046987 [Brachionus plicatilis]|uniref:Uncharacterized protein n=1 Tax=Brachionus plicatilis TaxID=10195 RepID=A0A3M7SE38_BRAPC|nr:hypothetical protein BpHYR1_046987 [Brachionus plicatilis]
MRRTQKGLIFSSQTHSKNARYYVENLPNFTVVQKSQKKFTKFKTLVLSEFHIFDSKFNSNLTNFRVIIDPSEEIRFKPEKTHFFPFFSQQKPPLPFFFLNYISIFIFEILSLKEQQFFKGFAIFGTLGLVISCGYKAVIKALIIFLHDSKEHLNSNQIFIKWTHNWIKS